MTKISWFYSFLAKHSLFPLVVNQRTQTELQQKYFLTICQYYSIKIASRYIILDFFNHINSIESHIIYCIMSHTFYRNIHISTLTWTAVFPLKSTLLSLENLAPPTYDFLSLFWCPQFWFTFFNPLHLYSHQSIHQPLNNNIQTDPILTFLQIISFQRWRWPFSSKYHFFTHVYVKDKRCYYQHVTILTAIVLVPLLCTL